MVNTCITSYTRREISKFKLDPDFCPTCKSSGVPRTESRNMTVLEYVAMFLELARFIDDYVAIDVTLSYYLNSNIQIEFFFTINLFIHILLNI